MPTMPACVERCSSPKPSEMRVSGTGALHTLATSARRDAGSPSPGTSTPLATTSSIVTAKLKTSAVWVYRRADTYRNTHAA
jgi:hypothetical protein